MSKNRYNTRSNNKYIDDGLTATGVKRSNNSNNNNKRKKKKKLNNNNNNNNNNNIKRVYANDLIEKYEDDFHYITNEKRKSVENQLTYIKSYVDELLLLLNTTENNNKSINSDSKSNNLMDIDESEEENQLINDVNTLAQTLSQDILTSNSNSLPHINLDSLEYNAVFITIDSIDEMISHFKNMKFKVNTKNLLIRNCTTTLTQLHLLNIDNEIMYIPEADHKKLLELCNHDKRKEIEQLADIYGYPNKNSDEFDDMFELYSYHKKFINFHFKLKELKNEINDNVVDDCIELMDHEECKVLKHNSQQIDIDIDENSLDDDKRSFNLSDIFSQSQHRNIFMDHEAKLLNYIGNGKSGSVYSLPQYDCVLKVYSNGPLPLTLLPMNSKRFITIRKVFKRDDIFGIIMDKCDGTLKTSNYKMTINDFISLFYALLKHDICHNDIKPSNMLVKDDIVMFGDLDLVRKSSEVAEYLGSQAYFPPTFYNNEISTLTKDIHALTMTYLLSKNGLVQRKSVSRDELLYDTEPFFKDLMCGDDFKVIATMLHLLTYVNNEKTFIQKIIENLKVKQNIKMALKEEFMNES